MQAVDPAVADALRASHAPVVRLHALASPTDLTVVRTWDLAERIVLDGRVVLSRSRQVRGSSRLVLANPTGGSTPRAIGDHLYSGSVVRIERGVVVAGRPAWVPLATHVIDRHRVDMRGDLEVEALDRLSLATEAFGQPAAAERGMGVGDAIRAWLEPSVGSADALWVVDDGGQALGTTVSAAEDDERLSRASALAADFALEVLTDRLGRVVVRPIADPTTAASVATYDRSAPDTLLLDLTREARARPYNRAIAVGEPLDGDVVRGTMTVDDPASPLHPDRIGLRTAPILRSAAITTQRQANEAARVHLIDSALVEETVDHVAVPDPRLDEGDVVTLREATTATDAAYQVETVELPVTMGAMTLRSVRTVPLLLP